jgi:purine-nucleoside phosphorylase
MNTNPSFNSAKETILKHAGTAPRRHLLVLGSGWGESVASLCSGEGEMAYESIPGFPRSTVEGHAGKLLWGQIGGTELWILQGRFHYYEGYSMQELTAPLRLFAELGVEQVLLTNAAGGIHPDHSPGDLMVISDHINLMGDHPLRGPNDPRIGPRFPDMTSAWDPQLQDQLHAAAESCHQKLHTGVYLAVSGPSFETPAEIRAFRTLGADAVGMSTVPECIVARHCGLRVAGLSCITNLAAGLGHDELSHAEVAEASAAAKDRVSGLLESYFRRAKASD